MEPRWLEWVRELQSVAQNGLAYCQNAFDIERFKQVRRVAAEITAAYADIDHERVTGLFEGEAGYATPKVDVRGAIFQGDQILMVQEIQDGFRWTLPGGWADAGDTPTEAVLREIREESGYEARVTKLAAVYDRTRRGHPMAYFSAYKLFFVCEITGGEAAGSIETGEVRFFSEDDLPELSLGRVTPQEIHMLFEHSRNPSLPTEYD
jgi:ADP-ribose pyrophosphatase YjhB (NUDIX family)